MLALLLVGLVLIVFGMIVLLLFPDRPGADIATPFGLKIQSAGAGLPLILIGVVCLAYGSTSGALPFVAARATGTPTPAVAASPTPSATAAALVAAARSATSSPARTVGASAASAATGLVIITPTAGAMSRVPAGTFQLCFGGTSCVVGDDALLPLASGANVAVNTMKSFEITDPGDGSFGVVITLLDGRVVADTMGYVAGVGGYCVGQTDLGPLRLNMRMLKKIEFQR